MIKNIFVVKETREGEKRVALVPNDIRLFTGKGYTVFVEKNAGLGAGYTDQDYETNGAILINLDSDKSHNSTYFQNTLILRVKRGSREREQQELTSFSESTCMMGFLDPLEKEDEHVTEWQKAGITTFSLDQLDLPSDDPKNVLTKMSTIAGTLAFEEALSRCKNSNQPNVIIIGTGPASVSAAFKAREKDFSVRLFGRSEKYRDTLEAQGINYTLIPDTSTHAIQAEFIRPFLKDADIVVTAARARGERAPTLIDQKSLSTMQPGTVIIDLASEGGNVESSVHDQTIMTDNGITIINFSAYPKKDPKLSSKLYSEGISQLAMAFLSQGMDVEHALLKPCYVTSQGNRNPIMFPKEHSNSL